MVVVMVVKSMVDVLVWTEAIIGMGLVVEGLVIDVRADVLIDKLAGVEIIVVAAAVSGEIMVFVPGIGVEILADANANIFTSLMTALEFAEAEPSEEFRC